MNSRPLQTKNPKPPVTSLVRILFLLTLAPAAAIVFSACAGKSTPQGGPVIFGVLNTNQIQSLQGAAVYFTGDVKLNAVPWHEGLTLAEALLQAQYTGYSDPFSITLTREGLGYRIDVRRLLRGEENLPLAPGDRINVRR